MIDAPVLKERMQTAVALQIPERGSQTWLRAQQLEKARIVSGVERDRKIVGQRRTRSVCRRLRVHARMLTSPQKEVLKSRSCVLEDVGHDQRWVSMNRIKKNRITGTASANSAMRTARQA